MLSNTGGNDRDNSSTGVVVVGDPKCANDTEVTAGVAVLSEAQASCDGFVSGGSGLGGWEAQDMAPGPDQTQGYAGGYQEILLCSNMAGNSEVFIAAPDSVSEVYVAAQDASSMACVFDYSRHCYNVNDQPKPSSLSFRGTFQEMHRVQLLQERKAKRVTIQSSRHW